jgi:hypothetical protein
VYDKVGEDFPQEGKLSALLKGDAGASEVVDAGLLVLPDRWDDNLMRGGISVDEMEFLISSVNVP